MRFHITTRLPGSREEVWRAFDSFENLQIWQPTLLRAEPISGEPGQVGTKTKLTYLENKRLVVLIEEITLRDQPSCFCGVYTTNGISNVIRNHFNRVDSHTTDWVMEADFQFRGFLRLIGWMMKGMIRKRLNDDTQRFLNAFKSKQLKY